ncbi:conserved hypothetical protein [Leishmania infantum JPCM5]|uniref:Uncharacterized protein n=2 Tax=Leishmania infantum TaxID=5671 RepID=A4I8S3_LEIIN|nr:conserved hypothetical protein [Leishmania infantum JPCM5]CAC9530345.1 hypothetical_protein_-_conserved [Leishmania infantum]CAM71222.1 conserved hypothetical protein [Leishmania infantum JPCM5]SUZ45059.1 hypothetical_protein_-_conserved [Leishmania infantum]|eukprot:XP_001468142.1 conserved hypothetical protein [Leishmania infantum JPCM5]
MLNGVNDILMPWTAPRILQIMEATSASRNASGCAPRGGIAADDTADMESLLRLANQLPDVAGRVMAAPLFAQRPLVESHNGGSTSLNTVAPGASSDGASSVSITYEDAQYMCTAALAVRRSPWKAEAPNDDEPSTTDAKAYCSLPHTEPQTAAAELEEVGFAAEFSEPCIRGSFPDAAAALRHVVPEIDGGLTSDSDGVHAQSASKHGAADLFQGALHFVLRPPSVSHAAPLAESASSTSAIQSVASATSHRLHLVQPSPSAASAAPQSLVLDTIPSPSLLPIEARGPPGHRVFDGGCVAYTFSAGEREELLASLCAEPPPLQVFSREEVEGRCQPGSPIYRQTSAPQSSGSGAAAAATAHFPRGGLPPSADRGLPGSCVNDDDGWSSSSGWSSRSSSEPCSDMHSDKAKEEASQDIERADEANAEERPGSRAVACVVDGPTSEVALATHPPGTAGTTCTWVDDADDLVLENGHIAIRRKRMRPARNLPAALSLPTVASSPLLNPSLTTTVVNATPADEQHFTSSATDGADYADAAGDGSTADAVPHGRKGVAGAKRSRASMTASAPADGCATATSAEPPERATTAEVAKELKRRAAPAETSDEVARTSTPIKTKRVVRLSQEEMLEFIEGLRVPDTLRRALLIGAATPAVIEAAPVNSPGAVGDGKSEPDGSDEAL